MKTDYLGNMWCVNVKNLRKFLGIVDFVRNFLKNANQYHLTYESQFGTQFTKRFGGKCPSINNYHIIVKVFKRKK